MLNLKGQTKEKSGVALKVTVFILVLFFLISTFAIIYFSIKDRKIEFSQEVIERATLVAQSEIDKAYAVTEQYFFEERFEAIQSIGYREPEEGQFAIFTFEKEYDEDDEFYVILKMKPHEEKQYLTRINVSVFDKEHRAIIVSLENILRWEMKEES